MRYRLCARVVLTAFIVTGGSAHGQELQIGTLSTDGCRVIDHTAFTGDDRGGIAVSTDHVLYTGDGSTGRFGLSDLEDGTSLPARYDALASDLRSGTVYTLGYGDTPILFPGGTVTSLLEIDPASGGLTGNRVLLSTLVPARSPTGIFSGYGRIVLYTEGVVYDVALPSGKVRRLGVLALREPRMCESWAFWGVVEQFGGSLHLAYRESAAPRIVRTRVDDGETSVVAELANLSDMCSFTVSPANDRWYFHHEGLSQLAFGGEILGFCDAVVAGGRRSGLSLAATPPEGPAEVGDVLTLAFTVENHGPSPATGVRFEGRLPATVELAAASPSQGRCRPGCESLVCELGRILPGASATIAVDVVPLRGGRLRSSATVAASEVDPDPSDNTASVEAVAAPSGSVLFSVDRGSDQLRALDANTGATLASITLTLPGETIFSGEGLAVHPSTGELWALLRLSGKDRPVLAILDPRTGKVTSIGESSAAVDGLAFDAMGTLYSVATPSFSPPTLVTLDPADATAKAVATLDADSGRLALASDPLDGLLYYFSGSANLHAIDPRDVGSAPPGVSVADRTGCSLELFENFGAEAFTHVGAGAFFLADGLLRLYRVTTLGERVAVGNLDHFTGGLAWVDLPLADLSVSQSASPESATVGSPLTYEVVVSNEGPDAAGAVLYDAVPGTVSLVSASASQGVCEADACGGIACVLGEIEAGQSARVTLEATPWAPGPLIHSATVPGLNDPDLTNNRTVGETSVAPSPSPVSLLSVDLSSNRLRTLDPTTGATLTSFPVRVPDAAVLAGLGLAVHPVTGEIWGLFRLAESRSTSELVVLDPDTGAARRIGDPGDRFTALAFTADGTLYGLTSSAESVTEHPHSLFILSQTDATASFVLSLGESAFYESESLAFRPDDGLLYVATGRDLVSSGLPSLRSIDPETLEVVEIAVCGDLMEPRGLTHLGGDLFLLADNSTTFRSLTSDGTVKTLGTLDHVPSGLAVVRPPARVDLALTQSADADRIRVGESLTVTLTVANEGAGAVAEVEVLDALPGSVSLVSATPSQGVCETEVCGELACRLGELASGDRATVDLVVTPFAPGTMTNHARAAALNDADLSDNESELDVEVRPARFDRELLSLGSLSPLIYPQSAVALHVVDPNDGSTLSVVEVSLEGATIEQGRGLAAHPVTGELYALLKLQGQDSSELVALHPRTGVARRIGDTGDVFEALAVDASGTLYGLTGPGAATPRSLFVLDPSDGSASFVLPLQGGGSLAFHPPDGLLYHAEGRFALDSVDPSTGAVRSIVACNGPSRQEAGALAHGGGDTLLLADRSRSSLLFRLTTAGGLTKVGVMDHLSSGLAWADVSRGDLSVTQTATPEPAAVGANLTYTVTVENPGADAFDHVQLVDRLPAAVRFVSAAASQGECRVEVCGGALACELGELGGGGRATVEIEVRPLVAGTITNSASVPALNDPDLSNNQAVRGTVVLGGPRPRTLLSIDGSAPTLRILDPHDGSTLSETPVGMAGETVTAGRGIATHPDTGELWALLQLAGQSETELATLNPATGVARRVGNTGRSFVGLAFGAEGTLYGVTAGRSDEPASLYVLSQTDARATFVLELGTAGGTLAVHEQSGLFYHAVGGLAVQTIDPAGSVTEVPACRFLVSDAAAMTYLRGDLFLLAGGSRLFTLSADGTVASVGFMDHRSKGLAFVRPLPASDVSVTVDDRPDPVTAGERLTSTLTVRNEGPGRASGLTLFDELPATASLVSVSPPPGGVCVADLCGEISCELGDLEPGATATVRVESLPWAAGTVSHTASVPVLNDPDPAGNRSVAETTVRPSSLQRVLLTVDPNAQEVAILDPFDGSTVSATAIPALSSAQGLAAHPQTGELWALMVFDDVQDLGVLDPATGAFRRVGSPGFGFRGLAFDAGGQLYSVKEDDFSDADSLVVLRQTDAHPSLLLSFDDATLAFAVSALDGRLYRLSRATRFSGEVRFQSVDLESLAITEIPICAEISGTTLTAMTHLGGDSFLVADDSQRLSTLTSGGVLKRVGFLEERSAGLAFLDLAFADLAVTQTASPDPVPLGGRLTYTVTVSNHGPDDVSEVTVFDDPPGTVSLLAATPSQGSCKREPCGGLICALGTLAAGGQATIALELTAYVAGPVTNRATVAWPNDPDRANGVSVLGVVVEPGERKRALYSVDPFSDQIRVVDPQDGSTVASIAMTLPGEVIRGGEGLAVHPATGELWALLDVGPGTSELVTINPSTGVATSVGDTGGAFTGLAFDAAGSLYSVSENFSSVPDALYTLSQDNGTPSFVQNFTGPSPGTIAFDPQAGRLYRAVDRLTLETVDLEGRASTAVVSTCSDLGPPSALTWVGGDLLLLAAGSQLFGLTTAGDLSPVSQLDHTSTGLAFVDDVTFAELSVTQADAPDPVPAGSSLTYTLTVANRGTGGVSGVTLFDQLPGTVSLIAGTPSQGSCRSDACGSLSCALGELPAGELATVAVEVEPLVPGALANTAFVPAVADPRPDDNRTVESTAVLHDATPVTLLSLDVNSDEMRLVDPADGKTLSTRRILLPGATVVGGRGLAVRPGTFELWAGLRLAGRDDTELVKIDAATGVAERVGPVPGFFDFAFDDNGTLYGLKQEEFPEEITLYRLSLTGGAPRRLLRLSDQPVSAALAFNPEDGLLYFASGGLRLQSVDPNDLKVTEVASCNAGSFFVQQLAHLGRDVLLLLDSRSQLQGLTTGGALAPIGELGHSSGGLAVLKGLPNASLTVRQTAAPDPVIVGGALTYTVTVENRGPDSVSGLRLLDTLPGTARLVSVSPSQGSCNSVSCGSLSCDLGELPAGAAATVTIGMEPLAAGSITNSVLVPFLTDILQADNESVLATTVLPGDDPKTLLSLSGFPPELRAIDPTDGSTLQKIAVTLPGERVERGLGLARHPRTGELWALLKLDGREDTAELVTLDPATGVASSVGSTGGFFASLAFGADGTLYAVPEDPFGLPSESALYVLSQADATPTLLLSLGEDAEGEAIAFNPVDGRLYHATGPFRLQSIDPRDLSTVEVAACDAVSGPRAATHLGGDTLLLANGTLFAVTTSGRVTVIGGLDHSSQGLAFVPELAFTDLTVSQSAAPAEVATGEKLTYTLTVANAGSAAFAGVTVLDALPATTSLGAVSPSQGTCAPQVCGGLSCDLGRLGAGGRASVEIEVTPLLPQVAVNQVSVPALGDPNPADNQSRLDVTVERGDFVPVLLSVDADSDLLRVIDPADGSTRQSRTLSLAGRTVRGGEGLAAHPVTGELWALLRVEGQAGSELVVLDPVTGTASSVGDTGDVFVDLAFDSSGVLYAISSPFADAPNSLVTLSQTDASPTLLLTFEEETGGGAISFNPSDGRLYRAFGSVTLQAVELDELTVTDIAACVEPFSFATALAHLGGGTMLLALDDFSASSLYAVAGDGRLGRIGALDHRAGGLAFAAFPFADLAITQTASPDPGNARRPLTYTLTVGNAGPEDVAAARLLDALPGAVSVASISASQGACGFQVCGDLLCDLGPLGAGGQATVTVRTVPRVGGTLTNTVVAPAPGDPDPSDNESALEVAVEPGRAKATLLSLDRDFGDGLDKIDPADGSFLGSLSIRLTGENVRGGRGLAAHPSTGELWALLQVSGAEGSVLAVVAPGTGVARIVGDTGDVFVGLAFDAEGTLYGVTSLAAATPESLFVLSQDDASPSFVVSLADGREGEALAFNPEDGLLYHASGGLTLRAIDPHGPTVSEVLTCPSVDSGFPVEALTHLGGNAFLVVVRDTFFSSSLFGLNLLGGMTRIGSVEDSSGLAFVDLPRSDLSVELTDAPDPVVVGERLTYNIKVRNTGPDALHEVTLLDELPATADLVSVTASQGACAEQVCGSLACDVGRLGSGREAEVTVEVTPLAAGLIFNRAEVPYFGDPDDSDNSAGQGTTVEAAAGAATLLSIDHDSGELFTVDPINGSTTGFVEVSLEGFEIDGGRGLAVDPRSGELWALLSGSGATALVKLDPATGAATLVGNTGRNLTGLAFGADGTLYAVTEIFSGPRSLYVVNQVNASSTQVLSLGDGLDGDAIAFNPEDGLLYHASGSFHLEAVDTSALSVTSIATCRGMDVDTRAMTHFSGDLMLLAGRFGFWAVTAAGGIRRVGELDHRSGGLAFVGLPAADLAVTLSDSPDPVAVGEPLTYTLAVANDGPDDVPRTRLVETLPGTAALVSATPSQGVCTRPACGERLVCDLGELRHGAAATLELELTPLAAGTVVTTAATRFLGDPEPGNDAASAETTVTSGEGHRALLAVSQFSDELELLDPGNGNTLGTIPITLEGATVFGGSGLATHPLTGEVWALLQVSGQDESELVTLDPITGSATAVGRTEGVFEDLAFDADGNLYSVTTSAQPPPSLYLLDQDDASASLVVPLTASSGSQAMAFNPLDGLLYHASDGLRLQTINPAGPTVTPVVSCQDRFLRDFGAMTYLGGDTFLMAANTSELYGLTTRGNRAFTGSTLSGVSGLTFVDLPQADLAVSQSAVPQPVAVGGILCDDTSDEASALAFVAEDTLLLAANGRLCFLATTGALRTAGALNHHATGLAFTQP